MQLKQLATFFRNLQLVPLVLSVAFCCEAAVFFGLVALMLYKAVRVCLL